MPQHLVQAFISRKAIFNHCGLSFKGMLRSLLINIWHGRSVQGKYHYQQLVKLLFTDGKKTFARSLKQLYAYYGYVAARTDTENLNQVFFRCYYKLGKSTFLALVNNTPINQPLQIVDPLHLLSLIIG
jgi:hypothetical protein